MSEEPFSDPNRDLLSQAYHEAAHAVTAEVLVPGCARRASLFPTRRFDGVEGEFEYEVWATDADLAPMVAAPAWAEKRAGRYVPVHHLGDRSWINTHVSRWRRSSISRRAHKLVDECWEAIERVAHALYERKTLEGDEIRELIREAQ